MSYDEKRVEVELARARKRHPSLFDKTVGQSKPRTRTGLQARIDQMGVAHSEMKKQKRVRDDLEHREQCTIVNHVQQRLKPHVTWFAVPNGGQRPNKKNPSTGRSFSHEGVRLKKEGVRAGVPDLHFLVGGGQGLDVGPVPKRGVNIAQGQGGGTPIYLEYKTLTGVLSPSQKDMRAEILAAGGVWMVAYGIDAAITLLAQYGVIWPDKSLGVQK